MNFFECINRKEPLFNDDLDSNRYLINDLINNSKILIIGAAGSIGQATTLEIFKRNPKVLHLVDISENNMVEVVRCARSTIGYQSGEFRTFSIDCGSREFDIFFSNEGPYDYVLNLSALKHVRSEKDPYTLMRLIDVNIFNTLRTLRFARDGGAKKYFCVSTDKAANPVNMMGGSKRIMEMFLMRESLNQSISMSRFANVAFSDGSLLHGFNQRFAKKQPFAAPNDVKRYFVTPEESGELCLLSCLLGENRDIYFPKLSEKLHLITFSEIACNFLEQLGFEAYECSSEDEARDRCPELIRKKKWPCYFFKSDTTGEKDFEEFYTDKETLNMDKFLSIGVIKNDPYFDLKKLAYFEKNISNIKAKSNWRKEELVDLFHDMIPDFGHQETGKSLDQKM